MHAVYMQREQIYQQLDHDMHAVLTTQYCVRHRGESHGMRRRRRRRGGVKRRHRIYCGGSVRPDSGDRAEIRGFARSVVGFIERLILHPRSRE